MIDVSGSMNAFFSNKSGLSYSEGAGVFGVALGIRAEHADVYTYDDKPTPLLVSKSGSVLRLVDEVRSRIYGGTMTHECLAQSYNGHDRVVILTDEQATTAGRVGPGSRIAHSKCPIYTFNLAGYAQAHLPAGSSNCYEFGGLTDQGFTMIEQIERFNSVGWPWES